MEAWESSDRIRPLPPEAPPNSTSSGPERTRRSWVPLAIAGIALGAFAVGSTLFARSEPGDAAGASTTTTTTSTVPPLAAVGAATTTTTTIPRPRSLTERVPNVRQVLIVMSDGTELTIEGWTVGLREPLQFESRAGATQGSFNVDGTLLSLISFGGSENGTLRVGEPTDLGTRFVDVTSAVWHDEEPRRIAFIARLPLEDELSLLTATVPNDLFNLSDLERVTTFTTETTLEAWGEWGFAVNTSEPIVVSFDGAVGGSEQPLTLTLDPSGTETARTQGWVIDALAGGRLLIRTFWNVIEITDDGVAVVVESHEVTRTDPSLVADGTFELLTPEAIAFLNPDGSHMSEVNVNPAGVTLVTSRDFDRPSNRSGSVPGLLDPAGFTLDGSLFVLHDPMEDELVFLDWSNGTQYRIPTSEGRAIAVDAR